MYLLFNGHQKIHPSRTGTPTFSRRLRRSTILAKNLQISFSKSSQKKKRKLGAFECGPCACSRLGVCVTSVPLLLRKPHFCELAHPQHGVA